MCIHGDDGDDDDDGGDLLGDVGDLLGDGGDLLGDGSDLHGDGDDLHNHNHHHHVQHNNCFQIKFFSSAHRLSWLSTRGAGTFTVSVALVKQILEASSPS